MSDDMLVGAVAGFGWGMFFGAAIAVTWLYARLLDDNKDDEGKGPPKGDSNQ